MNYDVDYFIKKFEATKEEMWCMYMLQDCESKCALGQCSSNVESEALINLFYHSLKIKVTLVNDDYSYKYPQATPKQRILAALYDIKKLQQPVYTDITKELAVLPKEETPDKIGSISIPVYRFSKLI